MRFLTVLIILITVTVGQLLGQNLPTPSQAEGPYYPVEIPADHDWNLAQVEGRSRQAEGTLLELTGTVLDSTGTPVKGVTVEIWQTDSNGRYMHPTAPGTNRRDKNFQFYGEAVTDSAGIYRFLTILPELYGSRPRHIHVKVRSAEGRELLTTQFYFPDDPRVETDFLTRHLDDKLERLMVRITSVREEEGREIMKGEQDILLRQQ
jgi:protocatechuate 3,4-dioxygenase beta subunit